jgi:hypothetical protein
LISKERGPNVLNAGMLHKTQFAGGIFLYPHSKTKTMSQNFHVLQAVYLQQSAKKPARVKITSHRFKQSITVAIVPSFDNMDVLQIAGQVLAHRGYKIKGYGMANKGFILLSSTFEPLKK